MYETNGAPCSDLYSRQPSAHLVGSPVQPFTARTAFIDASCHSNFTSGSVSPARCRQGHGLSCARIRTAPAAPLGATAANVSGRALHSRYVNAPPLEWPVE